jgi:hypothetical protein
MKFAVIGEEERREAEPDLSGKCRVCGDAMIAKCGEHRVWHWAHRRTRTCDPWWEPETEWHRAWKNQFPPERQEVIHQSEAGEKHIADVKTEYRVVLEFQHSHLRREERESRETFYQKMVWVVDGVRRKRDTAQFFALVDQATILNREPLIVSVPWKEESALLRDWEASDVPVYFDFRERAVLWRLDPCILNVTPLWGPSSMTCLTRVPKDVFLYAKLKGQPFEKMASAEVERAAALHWRQQAQSHYYKDYQRYLARRARYEAQWARTRPRF